MRIALLGHIRHPIAQPFMGGMEAHSWMLADGLRARGHDVTLFASGDSDPRFKISPIVAEHYDRTFPWHDFHGTDALNSHLDAAFAATCDRLVRSDFDVVHNNSLHRFAVRLAQASAVAMVTTLHVPPFIGLARAVRETAAPSSLFTVPSTSQLRAWWPDGAPAEAVIVPNGIDIAQWRYSSSHDGGAIWFGRITPNKGTHLAAAAATIAGIPLTIYGTIEHRDYFETEVRPLLTEKIKYGGHLDGPDLAEQVRRAAVLLFTPLWDEPFGLAAVEAMACGVPVASLDSGAAREVIGEAGCFADSTDAESLAAALHRAMAVPRPIPRARVERLFTLDRMIDRYEELYGRVRRSIAAPASRSTSGNRAFEGQGSSQAGRSPISETSTLARSVSSTL